MPASAPLSASCDRLALGMSDGRERCRPDGQTFLDELELAIDQLVAEQPQIFDTRQVSGPNGFKVLSEGAFFVGVIKNLDRQGLCGGLYGEELAITNVRDFSDNYDIINSDHFIRRGSASYRSTCSPASFTTPRAPSGNSPGCSLPASVSIGCEREAAPVHRQQVEDAIDQITREQPAIFDFNDVQPGGAGWYAVRDVDAYTSGLVRILTSKGLCARWDGEEINIKTNNVSSENYDILTAERHIRRGDGSYRVTCYPAYF
jgi:hypothetical protein